MRHSLDSITAIFKQVFATNPTVWADAGGRVNIIGEHTDYHDGFVLPTAIDLRSYAVASGRDDGILRIYAADYDGSVQVALDELRPFQQIDWRSYTCGPFWSWLKAEHPFTGADVVIGSNVPAGGGLSSSASIEVTLLGIAKALSNEILSCLNIAIIARAAENLFCDVPCGIMDQMASSCGQKHKALLIDCRSLETKLVATPNDWVFVVADSGVPRSLATGEYARRRSECDAGMKTITQLYKHVRAARDVSMDMLNTVKGRIPEVSFRRLRHAISENERTLTAADALKTGGIYLTGQLMQQSHESLAKDYEVSCRELDTLVEIASGIKGCVGARLTGAGFGGNTVNLVHKDAANDFCSQLKTKYREATGIKTAVRIVRPSAGLQTGRF
ncbi:MAG TPA: galactokinase [Myxococcota bacterium]|nr:galactokinase [Myxococcota bacterium]HQI61492.1 galactokinase [Myxococcota bacterium]